MAVLALAMLAGTFAKSDALFGDIRVQERGLVGAQLRYGFASSLVNRPTSFPGAPVKPFYGAGDERIVVVHF